MTSSDTSGSADPTILGGRYEVHRLLARGGMAEVFLARDSALDRPVAVKVLFSEFATDPAFVERFRREAQAAANLTHPNIVGVYDWGAQDGTYFIVMEYVDGQSLAQLMHSAGPLQPRRVAEIGFEVAGGLGYAHQRGVVHRDVKPGNVLLSSTRVAKVTDFGIARALSSPSDDLTQAGSVMGTASYFSPEQAQGFAVDARSDLYSLGVVLFELLAGRPPFVGDSPVSIAYKHVQERPPRPSEIVSGVPIGLEAVILKLLSKDPDNRYLSADDLRADLRRFLDNQPTLAEQGRSSLAMAATPGIAASELNPTVANAPIAPVAAAAAPIPPNDGPPAGPAAEEPRRDRTGMFIAIATVLVLALAALAVWLVTSLNDEKNGTAQVEVPAIAVGTPADVAKATLTAAGFAVDQLDEWSDASAKGTVFAQDPAAGTKLAKGDSVTIKVSKGPTKTAVPKVTNLPVAAATDLLVGLGFTVVPNEVESDLGPGIVVDSNPKERAVVDSGSQVTLMVSRGKDLVTVPSVAGDSVGDARAALAGAGFTVAGTRQQASATVESGLVIGTDPTGDVPGGSSVTLLVSSGPQKVKVPNVIGQTEDSARAALNAAGLTAGETATKSLPAGDPNDGRVISTSVAAGTSVDPDTSVSLTVGVASKSTTTSSAPGPSTTTTTSP